MGTIFAPLIVKPFLNPSNNDTTTNNTSFTTKSPFIESNLLFSNCSKNCTNNGDNFENKLPLPFGIIGVLLAIIGLFGFILYFFGKNKSNCESNESSETIDSEKSEVSDKFSKKEEWYIVFWGALAIGFYVGIESNSFQFLATYVVDILPESEYTKTERTQKGADLSAGLGKKFNKQINF